MIEANTWQLDKPEELPIDLAERGQFLARQCDLPLFRMKDDRPGQTMMVYLPGSEPRQ
jgi:hypothetical protein